MTQLKIENNPYARAFRESISTETTKSEKKERHQKKHTISPTPSPPHCISLRRNTKIEDSATVIESGKIHILILDICISFYIHCSVLLNAYITCFFKQILKVVAAVQRFSASTNRKTHMDVPSTIGQMKIAYIIVL